MTIELNRQTDAAGSATLPAAPDDTAENSYHLHTSDNNDSTSIIVVGAYGHGQVNSRGYRHPSYKLGKPQQLQVSDETWSGLETLLLESDKKRMKRILMYNIFALHLRVQRVLLDQD